MLRAAILLCASLAAFESWGFPGTGKYAPIPAAVVQHKSAVVHAATINLAFTSNVSAGNLLVACAMYDSAATGTVSDNKSNVWLLDSMQIAGGMGACWHVGQAASGATTVTVTATGSAYLMLWLVEVSGGYSVLDQVSTATGASGASASVTTAAALQSPNEYVMGFAWDFTADVTWTAGAGYTLEELLHDATNGDSGILEDLNSRTGLSGTQTATASKPNNSDTWGIIVLSFRQSPMSVVQEVAAAATGATTTFTVPIPSTGSGNLLVLAAAYGGTSQCISSIHDNASGGNNTFSSAGAFSHGTNAGSAEIWFAANSKSAGTTLTITVVAGCSGNNPSVFYFEVAGMVTASPQDGSGAVTNNHAANATVIAPTVTTTTARSFIFSVAPVQNTISQTKAGTNFVPLPVTGGDDAAFYFSTATGTYGATWTQPSGTYCGSTAAFKGN